MPIPDALILSEYPSDVTSDSVDDTLVLINSVLHAIDEDEQVEQFWIPDITIYPRIHCLLIDTGFSNLRFTPFSSPDHWNLQHPSMEVEVGADPITAANFDAAEATF
jgi:hypothetical protein